MASSNRRNVPKAEVQVAAASVAASYAAAGTFTGDIVCLSFANSLDGDVTISLDGGTTDYITLPAGLSHQIQLGALQVQFSGTISLKRGPSGASTTGFLSIGAIARKG